MQISLSSELATIVEQQIASGAYNSPEEVITAALLQLTDGVDPDQEEQIEAENRRRWQKFKQMGRVIPHQVVAEWVYSLGTDNPLPCPK
nr:MAG: hypothetical protein EDM05_17820 [Leptolyngbya sp. IPPAS B-1204]